jgi:hypothetical protein
MPTWAAPLLPPDGKTKAISGDRERRGLVGGRGGRAEVRLLAKVRRSTGRPRKVVRV